DDEVDANEKEIKNEPSSSTFDLGFLDELDDVNIERVLNQIRSRQEEIDRMDLKPPKTESHNSVTAAEIEDNADDADDDEELKKLSVEHNKILEELQSREAEKERKKQQENTKKRKHKKEKKHKKHRSRSPSPEMSRKKHRGKSSRGNDTMELDHVPVRDCEKTIKIINIKKLLPGNNAVPAAPKLSIREKRKLAVERVKSVLELLALKRSKTPSAEFLVVDTIKKLPGRSSVLSGANFQNPSPLSNNFNVKYQFNSTTPNISLSKWGLEELPPPTISLLRLTGIDVTRLMKLMEHSKMPLQKLRQQENALKASKSTEDEYMCTGLFRSLATQTDRNIGNRTRDIAVQVTPPAAPSNHGIFWLDPRFCDTNISQQQANVFYALKELCATMPSSTSWADSIYRELHRALVIKRAEVKQLQA
ncbi:hypothetical protein KR044_011118, partial [Drosophila immigrans]